MTSSLAQQTTLSHSDPNNVASPIRWIDHIHVEGHPAVYATRNVLFIALVVVGVNYISTIHICRVRCCLGAKCVQVEWAEPTRSRPPDGDDKLMRKTPGQWQSSCLLFFSFLLFQTFIVGLSASARRMRCGWTETTLSLYQKRRHDDGSRGKHCQ